MNTLSTGEDSVTFNGSYNYKSLNWIYLYDADFFLKFLVLIRILDPISVPNQSRDSFFLNKLNILSTREVSVTFNGS